MVFCSDTVEGTWGTWDFKARGRNPNLDLDQEEIVKNQNSQEGSEGVKW